MGKLLKSKGGFTLVEIMIALSILMLVIFTFTPVMLQSLVQIKASGDGEAGTYTEQAEIEQALADRDSGTASHPDAEVPVIFEKIQDGTSDTVMGSPSPPIPVYGKNIKGNGKMALNTFYVDKDPVMRAVPASICDDLDIESRPPITLYGDGVKFAAGTESSFSLRSMRNGGDGTIIADPYIIFTIIDETTATMKLSKSITMANGPYQIRYGTAKADLVITPPAILIVGDNRKGQAGYWVSDGKLYDEKGSRDDQNGKLSFNSRNGFPQEILRGVVWNDYKLCYEVVGDLRDDNNLTSDKALYSYTSANRWQNLTKDRLWEYKKENYIDKSGSITEWPSDHTPTLYDTLQLSNIGVFSDGSVFWAGSYTKQCYINVWWLFPPSGWRRQVWHDESGGFYGTAGQAAQIINPEIRSVEKILTGFKNGADGGKLQNKVDVIFGNLPNSSHYTLDKGKSNVYIAYATPESGWWGDAKNIGPITAAAYGLIPGTNTMEPCYKVVTDSGQIYRSPDTAGNRDGIGSIGHSYEYDNYSVWTADNMNNISYPNNIPRPITDMVFGLDRWVAVGYGSYALYSTDGVSWRLSEEIKLPSWSKKSVELNSIAYTNGYFVAVGNEGVVAYSQDGKQWTTNVNLGSGNLYGVAGQ